MLQANMNTSRKISQLHPMFRQFMDMESQSCMVLKRDRAAVVVTAISKHNLQADEYFLRE